MDCGELMEKTIMFAYRAYNKMGFGFLETVYDKCLQIELKKTGIDFEAQKPIKVYYDNEIVGEYIADIIVNDVIIVELKSVRRIIKAHEMQFELISKEADGESIQVGLLMVHAQDHLMTSILARELIEEMIELYKR